MKINVNNEMVKGGLMVVGKLGKKIVIEGTKAVILNAAATTIKTSFDEGIDGVKNLSFDDLLDGKDKKKSVSLFGKKKKKNDEEEIVVEILDKDGSKVTK